ncbi:MAG: hypothetical protein QXH95_05285 [Thermoplasmata archaeon]
MWLSIREHKIPVIIIFIICIITNGQSEKEDLREELKKMSQITTKYGKELFLLEEKIEEALRNASEIFYESDVDDGVGNELYNDPIFILTRATKEDPENAEAWIYLGKCYFKKAYLGEGYYSRALLKKAQGTFKEVLKIKNDRWRNEALKELKEIDILLRSIDGTVE